MNAEEIKNISDYLVSRLMRKCAALPVVSGSTPTVPPQFRILNSDVIDGAALGAGGSLLADYLIDKNNDSGIKNKRSTDVISALLGGLGGAGIGYMVHAGGGNPIAGLKNVMKNISHPNAIQPSGTAVTPAAALHLYNKVRGNIPDTHESLLESKGLEYGSGAFIGGTAGLLAGHLGGKNIVKGMAIRNYKPAVSSTGAINSGVYTDVNGELKDINQVDSEASLVPPTVGIGLGAGLPMAWDAGKYLYRKF